MSELIKLLLLGVVQGLTEFLPVSSSGHLTVGQHLLGLNASHNAQVIVVLHLGTMAAVLIYFRRDFAAMVLALLGRSLGHREEAPAMVRTKLGEEEVARVVGTSQLPATSRRSAVAQNRRLVLLLIFSTLPLLLAIPLGSQVEALAEDPRLLWVVGVAFLVTAAVNLAIDLVSPSRPRRADEMGILHALAVGFFQLVALIPGISRSGSTILGGELVGLDRNEAARYSFLLSSIAILGSAVFTARELGQLVEVEPLPLLVGFIGAMVSGMLAIHLLLALVRQRSVRWFGLYTGAVGVVVLILALGSGARL